MIFKKKYTRYIFILGFIVGFCFAGQSQTSKTADELYTDARNEAFKEKDYVSAIRLIKQARKQSPHYLELSVFLGRLYTFTDSLPQARKRFKEVLLKEAGHEQASLAYANLEYWNSNAEKALVLVNNGLEKHPESQDLGILKAKVLKDLGRLTESRQTLDALLSDNPQLTEARGLISSLNSASTKNSLWANYEFSYFDKRFNDPWHLASIEYSRNTSYGPVAARVNYANRFTTNGLQYELEAYPRISNTFYTYIGGGISEKDGIFPRYRAGFSLFANLPKSFEADLGFRYLNFNESTWIYTLGVGKYYKNYWFNLRTYLTPSETAISQTYALTVRYYLGGADDFFSLKLGRGISPDDSSNSIQLDPDRIYRLRSNNISLGFRKVVWKTNVVVLSASLYNQEYARDTRGNQFSVSAGYIRRF